ncbi:MAG: hypothetical protein JW915_10080 [Chitinispirillaceae bacterium]|nr:hypothetical protein [Chitinispirillaceae bacterium]
MNKTFLSLLIIIQVSIAGKGVVLDTISLKPELVVACTVWTGEGNIYKAYTLKNGKFHGAYLSYYKTGKLKETTKYKDVISLIQHLVISRMENCNFVEFIMVTMLYYLQMGIL